MPVLADILEGFSRLDGVRGTLILEPEGGVRAEHVAEVPDKERLVESVRLGMGAASQVAACLEKGALSQQVVEFSGMQITAEMLEGGFLLVVVADPGANLGRIRLELRKNKKAVESTLT